MRYILAAAALVLFGQAALAFEESTVGGEQKTPPPVQLDLPKVNVDPSKGLNTSPSGLHLQTEGTEVNIPGLGKVGVLPKLDLGLEILHGSHEEKGTPQDKGNSDDAVRLRGTVKYRF
jgi:hypothetical protein